MSFFTDRLRRHHNPRLHHFARYFDAVDRADFDAVLGILDGATVSVGDLETADPAVIRNAYAARHVAPSPTGDDPRRTTSPTSWSTALTTRTHGRRPSSTSVSNEDPVTRRPSAWARADASVRR